MRPADLLDIFSNKILISSFASWLVAQVLKTLIHAVVNKSFCFSRLTGDGGMPSAHSATVSALAVSSGLFCGFSSPVFAIAVIIAFVVMHDAAGIRYEAEKHAQALTQLFDLLNADMDPEMKLKKFLGHTPLQVLFGSLTGIFVSIVIYILF